VLSVRQDNHSTSSSLKSPPILTSWQPDLQSLLRRQTRLTLTANHWLHVIESKFGLLHCSEFQKTLYAAQQLRGSTSTWWARILPLFRTIPKCRRMSSAKHSMGTTFQLEPCTATYGSFWIYNKGATMCMSTSESLIIWHNTILIMLIPMRRR
jgi:hypothetical protein